MLYILSFNFAENLNLEILKKMLIAMILNNSKTFNFKSELICKHISDSVDKNPLAINTTFESLGIYFTTSKDKEKIWEKRLNENTITTLFLVASYQFISKGQNLQYKVINMEKKRGSEKDFDAIYLGEITNILPSKLQKENQEQTLLMILYSMTILENSCEISQKDKYLFLKNINPVKNIKNPYKQTDDYIYASMIQIIQSIGRLHRTDYQSDIYMFYHYTNKAILQNCNIPSNTLLPAVQDSIDSSRKDLFEQKIMKKYELSCKNKNQGINNNLAYIKEVFKNKNSSKKEYDQAIYEWEKQRSELLQYPTKENISSFDHQYFKSPYKQYWYQTSDDYINVDIYPQHKSGFSEVSFKSTRLEKLASIKELDSCLKDNNIATSFEFENLMIPIVFNNFYKGAIGEIFGSYILKKFTKITLKNLSYESQAPYETFDFSNEDERVYFDFKYFSTFTASNIVVTEKLVKRANEKLHFSNLKNKKVFIINLFVDDENKKQFSSQIEIYDDVYLVPWLIKIDTNNNPQIDYKMITKLMEYYDECIN